MDRKIAIAVKDLKKSFRLPHDKSSTMKQAAIGLFSKNSYSEFEVLKGLNFEIYEGEFFGIIGRNGSGKSTLLKILAGIYTYESGKLEINGKLSPFLELGVGFNPELSGRENVFLNGAILGLSRKEIEEAYDDIVEFSELEQFMDQKLKNYSSGMQVRLAFSVAIHAKAPIILLDEVLAVGDANFQQKCTNVFNQLKKEGRTIVFVTHSMEAVRAFCDRAVLIKDGKVEFEGDPEKVAVAYENLNLQSLNEQKNQIRTNVAESRWGSNEVVVEEIIFGNKTKAKNPIFNMKDNIEISFKYKNNTNQEKPINLFVEITKNNVQCLGVMTNKDKVTSKIGPEDRGVIRLAIKNNNFLPGTYSVTFRLFGEDFDQAFHGENDSSIFIIRGESQIAGTCFQEYSWLKK